MPRVRTEDTIESYGLERLTNNLIPAENQGDPPLSHVNEYAELKQIVKQRGLLEKQPLYYTYKIFLTLCLLAVSLALIVLIGNHWLQLLNAAFLAFVFGQISFIGHDVGHQQIFHRPWKNDVIGLIVNFLLGLSRTWWIDKHNRHHSNPNQLMLDPDTFIPVLAYSQEQARTREGFLRFMVRFQAFFFLPLLSLQAIGVRLASTQYLMHKRAKYALVEPLLMGIHVVAYLSLVFYLLNVWHAVLFILIHQLLFGLYLGTVFAPNHKGMPILEEDSEMEFLRMQVLTARNITAHPLTDFWYGGLNYQIEHHLFPNMPRNKLRDAQKIVEAFCKERSILYYETNVVRSYQEILRYLYAMSAPLREPRDPGLSNAIPFSGGGEQNP